MGYGGFFETDPLSWFWIFVILVGVISTVLGVCAIFLRRVVPSNEVHIVQSSKKTVSYGKDTDHGNTYYEWPSWVPMLGINQIALPVSVFDLDLSGYEAYDKGRLPFVVDVKAFFRICDSNMAAQRVASFEELQEQLKAVVQGAVRSILASNEIEEIMQGRSKFGDEFTKEVNTQLAEWGVATVKNIELMDIRDSKESRVIHNIMEKKKSHIEMESRTEVAKNMQVAKIAEIDANREVDLQKQTAMQSVGLREAEVDKQVSLAKQSTLQTVKEQERETKSKEMAVLEVESVRRAEIDKAVVVTKAKQDKEAAILKAEAALESKTREAEGVKLEGNARAEAEKAMQLAPVQAQIELAKEIGKNEQYQQYLVTIRKVEAEQAVGVKQAEALQKADIKIIANTGDVTGGISKVSDLFSGKGGTAVAAFLEGMNASDVGKAVIEKVTQ